MYYIVTGGAGFIGSALVWGLNKSGLDNILIVDHLDTDDKWKNLRALKFSDYMEKDDFLRRITDGRLAMEIEAIIHMGACSDTTEHDATYLINNNFHYSKELAKFAVAHELRFIYASSAATYGDGALGYVDDERALQNLRPLNMYGYSKQLFDLWARGNGLLHLILGLKFTNVFGPNEYHKGEMRSVANKAYHQIKADGQIKLFKSYKPEYAHGEQKRDFIYIKDVVEMVLFFLERFDGGLFNIGSGRAESWNRLAGALFKALGREPRIEYIDMPESLRNQYQYFTEADMTKLRNFGYDKELTPLDGAMTDYVNNYLDRGKYLGD